MKLRYRVNEAKALEALVYIATKWPKITPFYVAKVLFRAEQNHMNKYGRPITGDAYIAMENGPVPSRIRDYIEGNFYFFDNADEVDAAISVNRKTKYHPVSPVRKARKELFSKSDFECLDEAIEAFRGKTFDEVVEWAHKQKAWQVAERNKEMDYADFIDDEHPAREAVLSEASETAQYSVL